MLLGSIDLEDWARWAEIVTAVAAIVGLVSLLLAVRTIADSQYATANGWMLELDKAYLEKAGLKQELFDEKNAYAPASAELKAFTEYVADSLDFFLRHRFSGGKIQGSWREWIFQHFEGSRCLREFLFAGLRTTYAPQDSRLGRLFAQWQSTDRARPFISRIFADDCVEIADYDPQWPASFLQEAGRIGQALGATKPIATDHIGSTAVPQTAAKPIIDILVTVGSLAAVREKSRESLEALGYVLWEKNPKPDRILFIKGMPPYGTRRSHHLHFTEPGGQLLDALPFRDWLRGHPEDRERYVQLKRELAIRHRADREAYTEAKTEFVNSILAKAKAAAPPSASS